MAGRGKQIVIALAGDCAASLGNDDIPPGHGAGSDFERAYVLLKEGAAAGVDLDPLADMFIAQTSRLMTDNWAAVEALATALLMHRRLSGRRARSICNQTGAPRRDALRWHAAQGLIKAAT
jgi:hypothetical protein